MKKTLSSPLVAAANNIVSLGSRSNSLPRFQRDFNSFSRFLEVENRSLEKLKLPDKKKIRALASLNIASNFGRPGNLLSSLFSGALDLGGFVGNMFPGRGKLGKPQRPSNVKPPKPTIKGPRLKLGGMRAVGVGNALFAGLDFATGLAEGESVGKSAAGAGGALAGSLLGGAIGQALIPIPGLGFVVGSMAGSFLGGYTADRVYEGGSALKQKLSEKLKGQEAKQKTLTGGSGSFADSITKFDQAVGKFERGIVKLSLFSGTEQTMGDASGEQYGENIDPNASQNQGNTPSGENLTLDGEGTFIQGSTGRSDGPHFHIGPTELYDPVGDKWVGKNTEQGKKDAREAAFKVAKSLMQRKKYFRFTNAGIDVNPGSKLDDDTLMKYVEKEQYAHANRPGGGSWGGLDIAGAPGLRMPLPVGDVVSSVHGFGNAARIMGTNAFVGHGMKGSKKTDEAKIIKSSTQQAEDITAGIKQGKENVVIGDSIAKGQMDATGKKGKAVVGASPDKVMGYINEMNQNGRIKGNTVELSSGLANNVKDIGNVQKQLESLKSMGAASVLLSGTAKSGNRKDQIQANKELAALAAKYPGFVKFGGGFTPGADNVHPADAAAYNKQLTAMQAIAQPAPQAQVVPAAAPPVPQIQTYPSYNQPQSSMTVMPIMMGGGGGGQQRPVYIPVGGGGGGGTVIMPGPTEGQVVNSLMKTMLLTNLSAT